MVTNTKEYMREYQAKRRARLKTEDSLQENVKKDVKNVKKNKMYEIALERLKPPRASVKVETSDSVHMTEYNMGDASVKVIDPLQIKAQSDSKALANKFHNLDPKYQKWALSLETQRHYYYTVFGKVHRKNSIEVKKDLQVKNQELDMVELMKKSKVGLYRDCMDELKEVLERRKK